MRPRSRFENHPYARWATAAGLVGAAIVAVFFFVVDLLAGRPLATPTALGAALFLGEPFDLGRDADALLIAGYSAVHGAAFVGLTLAVTSILMGRPTRPPRGIRLLVPLASLFFAGTMALGVGFGLLSGASLFGGIGILLVAIANALASCGMAAMIDHALRTRWVPRPIGDVDPSTGGRTATSDPRRRVDAL